MKNNRKKATKKLTHIDSRGRVKMVDVTAKALTDRDAVARGSVSMTKETLRLITGGKIAKGDVFETARLAGIMAAKKTSELIPLCHQINLTSVEIDLTPNRKTAIVEIQSTVRCTGQTGVEMEALVAVSSAALAIYDMCKAVDKGMVISDVMLIEKRGGKSGTWKRKK